MILQIITKFIYTILMILIPPVTNYHTLQKNSYSWYLGLNQGFMHANTFTDLFIPLFSLHVFPP